MSIRISLADFIVKTKEGWLPADSNDALRRFKTQQEKSLLESYRKDGADRPGIRKQLFMLEIPSRRISQVGGVPVKEIQTNTPIPSSTKSLIQSWLLEMFNDEEMGEKVEEYVVKSFPDVLCSADKLSRIAQRLEDPKDLIHQMGMKVLSAAMLAVDSTIATEGKCEIVRSTDDSIIAKFDPVPEHLRIGAPRATFYKAFPVEKDNPMIYGVKALSGLSNRDFIMNHGHGHLRTIPYTEIPNAVKSFAKKNESEIRKILSDSLTTSAGDRFTSMCDMLLQKEKIETIIAKIMRREKQ